MNDYRVDVLPADLASDDPRYVAFSNVIARAFHEGSYQPETRSFYHQLAQARGARNRFAEPLTPDLLDTAPAGTFVSWDAEINVGHGRFLKADYISAVTVRTHHRRRGVLRQMMTVDLDEAAERGCAFATLTASEGSIYGRFGFGPATWGHVVEINPKLWALRDSIPGKVEFVEPSALGDITVGIREKYRASHRGAHKEFPGIESVDNASLDDEKFAGPDHKKRAIVHVSPAGEVDGFATFTAGEWGPGVCPDLRVNALVAENERVELALWDELAHVDLVTIIKGDVNTCAFALPWGLKDPRAFKIVRRYDSIWLRVLDPITALAERGWDRDGDLVLRITDQMGYADGTFAICVRDGRAEVSRVDTTPEVIMDVEALGTAYFGVTSIMSLAAVGRANGDVRKASRLFTVDESAANHVGF